MTHAAHEDDSVTSDLRRRGGSSCRAPDRSCDAALGAGSTHLANGAPTGARWRARATRRSIRSPPPTSARSKWRGVSRPTTSARGPRSTSSPRRSWWAACSTRPPGSRRAVVALDAATGEMKWMHSLDEGKRGEEAPRQLSGRGLAYWSDGRSARIIYVTPGLPDDCPRRADRAAHHRRSARAASST